MLLLQKMVDGVEIFRRFFLDVHGVEPFEWQLELARKVIEGEGWPSAIQVPTGFGKTATIDIAVVALALQADLEPYQRTAPTRTFLIVDRRLLVDQAFERAKRIAAALESPQQSAAVKEVANGLRKIAGGGRALEVVRMRGGISWSWRWVTSPVQPAVIAGTVDQFGSRFLFRGYGVGQRLRPIDAALCGNDALVLLDEAHLSQSLASTIRRARELEAEADAQLLRGRFPPPVLLSATLGTSDLEDSRVFVPNLDEESTTAATKRLAARRKLALCELDTKRSDAVAQLAQAMARVAVRALDPGPEGAPERIAVVANTVLTARATFEALESLVEERAHLELLVGRCRGFERDQLGLSQRVRHKFGAGSPRDPTGRPCILVATQTIEVGADFDVDFLVTEAAPLNSLIQRLGRLNRLGDRSAATGVCVFVPSIHGDDHVLYGSAIRRTWEWLSNQAGGQPLALDARTGDIADAPEVDVSLDTLEAVASPSVLEECSPEPPLTPYLVASYLDAWARTSPSPDPDIPVEPFLHGIDRGTPEVSVCWRVPLPDVEAWKAELEVLPIHDEECVEVPLWAARRFLAGLDAGPLSDVEGVGEPEEPDGQRPLTSAVVQRADDSVDVITDPNGLRAGDTLILDPQAGGHDEWGWSGKQHLPVPDVADLVSRSKPSVRLRPGVLAWATGEDESFFRSQLSRKDVPTRDLAKDILATAVSKAREEAGGDPVRTRWAEHADRMRQALESGVAVVRTVGGGGDTEETWLLVSMTGRGLRNEDSDEGEATTSIAPSAVALDRHLEEVAVKAGDLARRLGLPDPLVSAVEAAALLHDIGKAELRFQVMLHKGDPDRLEAAGNALAKSGMDPADRGAFRRARQLAGVPQGWRHERLSFAIAERILDSQGGVDPLLVCHLVATHHGHGRPLFQPVDWDGKAELFPVAIPSYSLVRPNGDGQESTDPSLAVDIDLPQLDHVDWSGPLRLHKLCRRYGWWGLALLETVVRLADIAVSESYG